MKISNSIIIIAVGLGLLWLLVNGYGGRLMDSWNILTKGSTLPAVNNPR